MSGTREGNTLRFERRLRHPIDKVSYVLTDERETGYWFPGRIVGPRQVGARVDLVFEPKPPGVMDDALAALVASKQQAFAQAPPEVFRATILAFDPPRVFELDWAGDRVRFELAAEGDVTRLVLTHTFLEVGGGEVAAGWHVSLDWLANRLSPGAPPTTLADFQALEAGYKGALG